MSNALATKDSVEIMESPKALPVTPYDMVTQAVMNGASVDVVGKLLDLHERWEANRARKAFDAAVSDAKAEIPKVVKNRSGHNSTRYADFSAYAQVVDPIISRHGLSYRFRTVQTDRISVTCILSHRDGHSEENTLSGPADKTGNKNDIQAIGSTLTYLQRYTLVQALGLAASNDDNGKAAGGNDDAFATVSAEQVKALQDKIVEVGGDPVKALRMLKIERFDDLLAADYADAMRAIAEFGRSRANA